MSNILFEWELIRKMSSVIVLRRSSWIFMDVNRYLIAILRRNTQRIHWHTCPACEVDQQGFNYVELMKPATKISECWWAQTDVIGLWLLLISEISLISEINVIVVIVDWQVANNNRPNHIKVSWTINDKNQIFALAISLELVYGFASVPLIHFDYWLIKLPSFVAQAHVK